MNNRLKYLPPSRPEDRTYDLGFTPDDHPFRICKSLILAFSIIMARGPFLVASVPVVVTHFNQPIEVDGHLDEPIWQQVEPVPLITQLPNFGQPPSERTEILLAYDDNYFYM